MIKRGYRAREQAGLERSRRRLVSAEIRAARAEVIAERNSELMFNVIDSAEDFDDAPEPVMSEEPDTSGITKAGDMVTVAEPEDDEDEGDVENDGEAKPARRTRAKK